MRFASNVHFTYTKAIIILRGEGYIVFEDGSYVLDTDEIDLFDLKPGVLTSEEIANLDAYIRVHPTEFANTLQ